MNLEGLVVSEHKGNEWIAWFFDNNAEGWQVVVSYTDYDGVSIAILTDSGDQDRSITNHAFRSFMRRLTGLNIGGEGARTKGGA